MFELVLLIPMLSNQRHFVNSSTLISKDFLHKSKPLNFLRLMNVQLLNRQPMNLLLDPPIEAQSTLSPAGFFRGRPFQLANGGRSISGLTIKPPHEIFNSKSIRRPTDSISICVQTRVPVEATARNIRYCERASTENNTLWGAWT
jgi:hypothetical protein